MTPEDRAKRVMFGNNAPFMDDDILTASHGYIISYPQLVAAIREAVMAEREACLRIIEHPNAGLEPPDGGAPTPSEMLANIAAAIRERPL